MQRIGLMFRTKRTEPLEFDFGKVVYIPIHSWFVFFKFKAEWFLEDGTKETRIVKPFQKNILPSKPFTKLIEIPM